MPTHTHHHEQTVPVFYDTLSVSQRLRKSGINKKEAEAIAKEMYISNDANISNFATKSDLKHEINGVKREINSVKEEIKGIKGEIKGIKEEINDIKRNIDGIENRIVIKLAALVTIIAGIYKAMPILPI